MLIVLTYFWLRWVLLHIWLSFTIHYFIFHFKCYSILHFTVCQLLCWAFLFYVVKEDYISFRYTTIYLHYATYWWLDVYNISVPIGNHHYLFLYEIESNIARLLCAVSNQVCKYRIVTALYIGIFHHVYHCSCSYYDIWCEIPSYIMTCT